MFNGRKRAYGWAIYVCAWVAWRLSLRLSIRPTKIVEYSYNNCRKWRSGEPCSPKPKIKWYTDHYICVCSRQTTNFTHAMLVYLPSTSLVTDRSDYNFIFTQTSSGSIVFVLSWHAFSNRGKVQLYWYGAKGEGGYERGARGGRALLARAPVNISIYTHNSYPKHLYLGRSKK